MTRINTFDHATMQSIIELVRRNRERIFPDYRRRSLESDSEFRPDHIAARVVDAPIPPAKIVDGVFTPSSGMCAFYYLSPNLPALGEIVPNNQRVWNYSLTDIYPVGTTMAVHRDQHGSWIAGDESPPKIRFITKTPMAGRKATATVTWFEGHALDPINLNCVQVGRVVNIVDPHNLWSEMQAGATGSAYLRPPREDDPDTSYENEGHPWRWEIEECTLPINEVWAKVEECLIAGQSTFAKVKVGGFPEDARSTDRVSVYPNVDIPKEWTSLVPEKDKPAPDDDDDEEEEAGGDDDIIDEDDEEEVPPTPEFTHQIEFVNPYYIHAIKDSYVRLRRRNKSLTSEPGNYKVPRTDGSLQTVWEVVEAEKPVARWGRFRLGAGSAGWEMVDYWDGEDPAECEIPVECEFDCECIPEGGEVVGCFDPERNKYRLIASPSAMLGTPETKTLAYGDIGFVGCGLAYTKQSFKVFPCFSQPQLAATYPDTNSIDVVTYVEDAGDAINIGIASIATCSVGPPNQISIPVEECPEPPCDEDECVYTWSESTQSWTLTTECREPCNCTGPPIGDGSVDGETASFPCSGGGA